MFDIKNLKDKVPAKKKIIVIIGIVLVCLFLLQCILGIVSYKIALTPAGSFIFDNRKNGDDETKKLYAQNDKWLKENGKEVTVKSFDNLNLNGYFVKNKSVSNTYVILCHPYNEDSAFTVPYALHYYGLGMNILLPDMRCHGKSEGKVYGMGSLEKKDLLDWISFVLKENENARIIIHGVGVGGTAACMASGEELTGNVRLIIDDGGFDNLYEEAKYIVSKKLSLPSFPALFVANSLYKSKTGFDMKDVSASKCVENCRVPVLFIHGEDDDIVPVTQGNRVFDSCSSKSYQYIVRGGTHLDGVNIDAEKYWEKIDRLILDFIGL